MNTLTFYDLKNKKKTSSDNYRVEVRFVKGNARMFAVHITDDGRELWRVLPSK